VAGNCGYQAFPEMPVISANARQLMKFLKCLVIFQECPGISGHA